MVYKRKKRLVISCVCFGVIALLYLSCNFDKIQTAISLKLNWNIDMPCNETIYNCSKDRISYYVCKISPYQQRKISQLLIEREVGPTTVKNVMSELQEIGVNKDQYPLFDTIDYSLKKTKRLSHLYLLYSSDSSIQYIIEFLD